MPLPEIDYKALADDELRDLILLADAEKQRRAVIESAPKEMEKANSDYLAAEGVESGEAWRQPQGAHDAYPLDWIVKHNSKDWISLIAYNVWEPGVAQWREHIEEPSGFVCPDFVQPTGAIDVYNFDDCVKFEGKCYRSIINNNSWSPTDYPAGWEEVQCV